MNSKEAKVISGLVIILFGKLTAHFLTAPHTELEFLQSLWGLGTKAE